MGQLERDEPAGKADGFVRANEALVLRYEGMDARTRSEAAVQLAFLPAPIDVATSAGFRLNEFTLHSWDVAVGLDPAASLAPDALETLFTIAPYLFGWLGRPGSILNGRAVAIRVETTAPVKDFGLIIADKAELADAPVAPDATLTLPAESWLRLVSGRLGPAHTPAGVQVTGSITLDELRQIFPGY